MSILKLLVWLIALGTIHIPMVEAQTKIAQPTVAQGKKMDMITGTYRFHIDLADTIAAKELQQLLPLTLQMQDHLSNEKHAELPRRLQADDKIVGRIEAGDILLWQGQTIVVFYKSFNSHYRYTRLGKIRNTQHLKNALGTGSIDLRFVLAD